MKKNDEDFQAMVRELAEGGDAEAQCEMGDLCANGFCGGKKDDFKAAKWYRLAVAQDNTMAMGKLGVLLEKGRGGKRDSKKATELFLRAGSNPELTSVHRLLGMMFYCGHRVRKDYSKAMQWFSIAAEKGDALSRFCMGEIESSGLNGKANPEKAAEYFRRACDSLFAGKGLDGLARSIEGAANHEK